MSPGAPDPRAPHASAPPRRDSAVALWWARARRQLGLLLAIAGTVLVVAVLMGAITGIAARAPISAVQHAIAAGPVDAVSRTVTFSTGGGTSPTPERVHEALQHRFAGVPVVIAEVATAPKNEQSWRIKPDAAHLRPEHLAELRHDYARVGGAVAELPAVDSTTIVVTGGGARAAADMERSLDALAAVLPIPAAVLVVAAAIALCLLAQLLVEARDNETRLLRARGAGIRSLTVVDGVEALVAASAGALVGTLAVQAVMAMTIGLAPVVVVLVTAVGVLLGAVVIVVAFQAVAAARTSGEPRQVSGRIRFAVSAGLTFVVIAAAAISLWRFITDARETGGPIDPIAVVAPAAALCALAVFAVLAFGPASHGVEAITDRSRGVTALPVRLVSRHSAVFAAPVALLTLAVAATTFASGYQGTWSAYLHGSARIVVGADARLDLATPQFAGSQAAPLDTVWATPGVRRAVPITTLGGGIGPLTTDVVAAPAAKLPSLDPAPATMFDASAVVAAIGPDRSPVSGIRLPPAIKRLTLDVVAQADVSSHGRLTVWLQSADGEVVAVSGSRFDLVAPGNAADEDQTQGVPPLPAGASGASATSTMAAQTVTFAVPAGGPWRLAALDAGVDLPVPAGGLGPTPLTSAEMSVTGLQADGDDVAVPHGWSVLDDVFGTQGAVLHAAGSGIGFTASLHGSTSPDLHVRLGVPVRSAPVPVALSSSAAAATGLTAGRTTTIQLPQGEVPVRVAAITPHVPGTADATAVLIDLASLTTALLHSAQDLPPVNGVLLATSPSAKSDAAVASRVAAAASRAASAAGAEAAAVTADIALPTRFIGPVVTALNVGAYGCCALAAVALAASLAALWRRRAGETVILRAVGFAPGQQARGRGAEAALAGGYAVVCGLVAGILIALLVGNTLAQSSVPDAPPSLPVHGEFDVAWLAVCLAGLLVVLGLVIARYMNVVRRDAVRAVPGRTTT